MDKNAIDRIIYESEICEILAEHFKCSPEDINLHTLDHGLSPVAIIYGEVFKQEDTNEEINPWDMPF